MNGGGAGRVIGKLYRRYTVTLLSEHVGESIAYRGIPNRYPPLSGPKSGKIAISSIREILTSQLSKIIY